MANRFPLQPFLDGTELASNLRAWNALAQRSMFTFNEPILQGWTFNIDSNNSTDPDTEHEVLRSTSYGKQLGKLTDAVAQLVALAPPDKRAAFGEFTAMKKEVDGAKKRALAARVARVKLDLERLKDSDADEYERLRAMLPG